MGGDVKLRKRGDEMFITIGNFKREMILPTVLTKRRAGGGSLQDGVLEITFLPPDPVTEPAETLTFSHKKEGVRWQTSGRLLLFFQNCLRGFKK